MAATGVHRHDWTAEQDALLAQTYLNYSHGRIKCLSIDWGIPANTLANRAKSLGLPMTRPNSAPIRRWTDPEDQIVILHGYLPVTKLREKLRAAGFRRGRSSISNRRLLLRQRGEAIDIGRPGLTVEDVATGLGCSVQVVCSWIRRGLLAADPTTSNLRCRRYVITHAALRAFCLQNTACLINCKPDLVWYTDLISRDVKGS